MAFSGLARLREAATSLRVLQRGRIRIASETLYSEGFVPHLAAAYHAKHEEVCCGRVRRKGQIHSS